MIQSSEYDEQVAFVDWLTLKGYVFTAIPNSTYTRSWSQKRKNTAMGLRAGFPDMVVIADNIFMCIEMKKTRGGVVSAAQTEWSRHLKKAGIPMAVCHGAEEAIDFVEQTVSSRKKRKYLI